MKQIAFRGRLLLRKILTGLSLGAVALTFQACYGPPQVSLNGTIKSDEGPIGNIQVSIHEYNYGSTDGNGKYRLFVDNNVQTVRFKDVENGEFQDKEVTWHPGDGPLNVVLHRKQ